MEFCLKQTESDKFRLPVNPESFSFSEKADNTSVNQYEAATSTRGVRFISRAMGTGEIRRDNTPILAHEGEKVLTKQETRQNGEKEGIIVNFNGLTIEKEADVDVIMEMMLRKLLKIKANMA